MTLLIIHVVTGNICMRTNQKVDKQNWHCYQENDKEDVGRWVVEEIPFIEDNFKVNLSYYLDNGPCYGMSRGSECNKFSWRVWSLQGIII